MRWGVLGMFVLALACNRAGSGSPSSVVVGEIRVTAISPTLVRLEQKGPQGFEDRATFNVVNRSGPGAALTRTEDETHVLLSTAQWKVRIPRASTGLDGVTVESPEGKPLSTVNKDALLPQDLPAPSAAISAWMMPDHPRVVPPAWGATPPPEGVPDENSGWDVSNGSPDVYVFVPGAGGYAQLRRDFLQLTGPIPLPPLYTFGYWTSRWHAYTAEKALAEMDEFRRRKIPLDLFVVDTDWRVGASHGYAVNTTLFPDMKGFIEKAHQKNIRIMFNDHPEPVAPPITRKELQYRFEGLTSLLQMGGDVLWYDRNWETELGEPSPGLRKEVWGMRLYQDITLRFRPSERPLIMSNVQGISSGIRRYASDPAAHRFPIWWTGDTYADFDYLRQAVTNTVNAGVLSLLPYVNDDCGGHFLKATPELYVRFFEHCALSPVLRPHTTRGRSRLPWDFGEQAVDVARRYANLRYQLLPTLYAAARRAHDDGTPLLRRGDLMWPTHAEAQDPTQYLLGDDLWVAPVVDGEATFVDLEDATLSHAGAPGVGLELFSGALTEANRVHQATTQRLLFHGFPSRNPGAFPNGIGARWSTTWNGVKETGTWQVRLVSAGNGKLWVNDTLVIDDTLDEAERTATVALTAGKPVTLRVEHAPVLRPLLIRVAVSPPSAQKSGGARAVWVPPGGWEDAWTGERFTGPTTQNRTGIPLHHTPLLARVGGLVLQVPPMQHTAESPWDHVVVDAFVDAADSTQTRALYEDDGHSNAYLQGAWRRTDVTLETRASQVVFRANAPQGAGDAGPAQRRWTVRFHLPVGSSAGNITGPAGLTQATLGPQPAEPMPSLGVDVPPGPRGGSVVQVALPQAPAQQPVELRFNLVPAAP